MKRHPSREELIAAARTGDTNLDDHLAACAECRELFALFRLYQVAGSVRLPDAPGEWIRKAAELAEPTHADSLVKKLFARLTFDSWAAEPAIGVRGAAIDERRLRFTAESVSLDLRAEKQAKGWQFVARASGLPPDAEPPVLIVSGKKIHSDEQGYFIWTNTTPPARLTLQTGSTRIDLTDISWTRNAT